MTDNELMELRHAPKGAEVVHHFRNGNIKIAYEGVCSRCGNDKGVYYIGVCNDRLIPSRIASGVCFKCGGTGKERTTKILETPENEEKRQAEIQRQIEAEVARLKAEAEKKAAEDAKREAELKAKKAISQHVGTVGERIEAELELVHTARWEQKAFNGFGTETKYRHIFKDADGNVYTWKTGNGVYIPIDGGRDYLVAEPGDKITLKGTIKEHSEYKDEKQTVLQRCKILQIVPKAS